MDHEDFLSNLNDNLISKPLDEVKNEEFSSEVASGKVKFMTVVESLQGVLTNENNSIREKGIEFLSWLISKLPKELFNCSEISVLINFYCDCLKGHHNFISPAIRGLLELVKMKPVTKDDLINVLVTLFQNVNSQSQLHPDRMVLYSFLKYIVENFLEDLKPMGPDFVYGVISVVEGEADPFCLMLIFSFLPVFIKNFELGHLTEEMFEVVSCYFPLDFSPTSKDMTITREDLSEALHQCLSATDSFCEQSIPLILDKVNSSLKSAKIDCYKLLKECCKTMKVENIEKHINSFWKILSKDVLPGNDKEICDTGLSALTEMLYLLSKDEAHLNILTMFLDDILLTVQSLIKRIDENMFQPAIRVLIAASSSSKLATRCILYQLKSFIKLKSDRTLTEDKIILASLLPFFKIFQEFRISESQNAEEVSSYFELVALYLNAGISVDKETRKLAFMGILEILPDSSPEFRKKLYQIIMENITTKDDIRSSNEFIAVWRSLAENYQPEFYDFVCQSFPLRDTDYHFSNILWSFSLVADHPKFTGYVIPEFINVIESKRKYVVALESLLNACRFSNNNCSIEFFHAVHSEHKILHRLIVWCFEFKPKEELHEGKALHLLSEIIALVTRNQNSQTQQTIVDSISRTFFGDAPQVNGSGDATDLTNVLSDVVLVLEAVLGSIRPEVNIPMVWMLREKLTIFALTSTDDSVRLSSSRLLATFVNKLDKPLVLDLLAGISKDIFAHLEDDRELRLKLNASFLFTWVVKGVILRGNHPSEDWISTWFSLLGRKDIGEAIAEGFRTVIEEDNLYLNLSSHCNVRVLYRQRLFGNHSKLVKMFEVSDWSVRMNYLLALVRLLQGVPVHLIQMEISSVITILVRCLDTEKPEVLLTSLEILTALLENQENIFSDYIQSFVPRFLKLATFENYMKIRINALKCLYFYGFYPTPILLPFKHQVGLVSLDLELLTKEVLVSFFLLQVIQDLELCLDDKKRLARKEAVRARCRWFLVGAPGEDILGS